MEKMPELEDIRLPLEDGEPEAVSQSVAFEPTREAGLERLNAFLPSTGRAYASTRNSDFGPQKRSNVSVLSPWLRHRLVLEEEVVRATLNRYSLSTAEKFIQEVFWRTYFKGWLEQRPDVWTWYRTDVRREMKNLNRDGDLRRRYEEAIGSKTGIECFDVWSQELIETGYLHNHTRMWFASIWIFTLKLPWVLGADFFYRYLLDGDPASNTCSWRWVAGLHTKGKTYLARVSNIAKFTDGRFRPEHQLANQAPALEDAREARLIPSPVSMPHLDNDTPYLLLLTEEDLAVESLTLSNKPEAVMGLCAPAGRSPMDVSQGVLEFTGAALENGLALASQHFQVPLVGNNDQTEAGSDGWAEPLRAAAREVGAKTIVTPHAPMGPVREKLRRAAEMLADDDIRFVTRLRPYDELAWPHATKGFFGLKKQIPKLVEKLALNP